MSNPTKAPASPTRPLRRRYVPAVGPNLKKILLIVFGLFALLAVDSIYLIGVRLLEAWTGQVYQNWFYLIMFLLHLILGGLLLLPFLIFATLHLRNAYPRPNRRAVRVGVALFITGLALLASGLLLTRADLGLFKIEVNDSGTRSALYWIHVLTPLLAIWLFVLHRLAGRRIKWRVGGGWALASALFALIVLLLQAQDPRAWNQVGNPRGDRYFFPSLARTVTGGFIPARVLDNDRYCQECHSDVHQSWSQSVHRFSSFNNPAYTASVRETRQVLFARDNDVQGSRFCAGCHDPVPFFSGEFDQPRFTDPDYDLSRDKMANAGITCTSCHAITHVNSPRGNADYTIEEPIHYPFAFSNNRLLSWINRQLVKAKPEFHKKTFLKPLHRTTAFCGTCHKVHLPVELNQYKWLRGQNHQDSFHLSGVSGFGVASFYYPPKAESNCNGCHMPLKISQDFAARDFDGSGQRSVHDHMFPSANTAIAHLLNFPGQVVQAHQEFLKGVLRVDLFGIKEGARIDAPLTAPLRPEVPPLQPGRSYLLETVIRTLKMGHHFTQGTADSNQVWLEVSVRSGEKLVARSGGLDEEGRVDPYAHFVNAYVLDREGRRIDRRNAQDIFVSLYDNQIPPGAADVVHFRLDVPPGLRREIAVEVRLLYRKFDTPYLRYFLDDPVAVNRLPVTLLASDRVVFPLDDTVQGRKPPPIPDWERWNDYGIGLLRKTGSGQLRQAIQAFEKVESLGRPDGSLNLARTYIREGLVQTHAPEALRRAQAFVPEANQWTLLWLSGLVNKQNGNYEAAMANFQELVRGGFPQALGRGFDFSKDYRLLVELGQMAQRQSLRQRGQAQEAVRDELLSQAEGWYRKVLEYDPENLAAHWGLRQVYADLGNQERARHHARLHSLYKPDDNARDQAIAKARRNDPAANLAAEAVVVYLLRPVGSAESGSLR